MCLQYTKCFDDDFLDFNLRDGSGCFGLFGRMLGYGTDVCFSFGLTHT